MNDALQSEEDARFSSSTASTLEDVYDIMDRASVSDRDYEVTIASSYDSRTEHPHLNRHFARQPTNALEKVKIKLEDFNLPTIYPGRRSF
jgi:hypothetical protein